MGPKWPSTKQTLDGRIELLELAIDVCVDTILRHDDIESIATIMPCVEDIIAARARVKELRAERALLITRLELDQVEVRINFPPEPEPAEPTIIERVRQAVCATPATAVELAERLGISRVSAASALSKLYARGLVGHQSPHYGPPEGWAHS